MKKDGKKRGYLKRMSRRLIVILVLGMLVLTSVQMVSATGEVTWWWKGGGIMDQTKPIKTSSDKITLTPSDEASWDAGNAAEVDLTFPAGTLDCGALCVYMGRYSKYNSHSVE